MTETILLSCPPDTPESKIALTYCTKQTLEGREKITFIFFIGHGVAHAMAQHNNNINEWQSLSTAHHIPLYYCAHSMEQFVTSKTHHNTAISQINDKPQPHQTPFQTAGLGTLVEACIKSSLVTSFAPQNTPKTQNDLIIDAVINTAAIEATDKNSQKASAAKQETEKSALFNLHCHDIMCHVTTNALFNIALILLVFEQKVVIYLQNNKNNIKTDKKSHTKTRTKTIDTSNWTTHHATALTNLKDMGVNAIILDKHLAPQLATPLRDLGLDVITSTDISMRTPKQNSENKNIYI